VLLQSPSVKDHELSEFGIPADAHVFMVLGRLFKVRDKPAPEGLQNGYLARTS
jgi:hypothetical protein